MNKAEFIISITIALLLTPMLMEIKAIAQPELRVKSMQVRAQSWFESDDIKKRRKQMRQMTRALKQPCKYCHTAGFNGYTDRHSISLEMMVLSVEHAVQCDECHMGKKALTPMGMKAEKMMKISQQLQVECNHCHVKQQKFRTLTPQGETYRSETESKQAPVIATPPVIRTDAEPTSPNQDAQLNRVRHNGKSP